MHPLLVLNAVGLTRRLIGPHTPRLSAFLQQHGHAPIGHVLPAVTTTVQSTYLTGTWPSDHGIVANGWYFRDECEVKLWRQSNKLVQRPKVWDLARQQDPGFTCANLFWWYNMYSTADYSVTPRPMYPADGRKLPDVYSHPASLRDELQRDLGQFPLFHFWGPATSIKATQWIADSAIRVHQRFAPTLTLVYLPHLDYVLQKFGPDANHPQVQQDLRDLDAVVGRLLDAFPDHRTVILSEYGILPVRRPIDVNRVLRRAGLVAVREELGRELLDAGASAAFALADHQIAHVYVNERSKTAEVKRLLESTPDIARVLDDAGKREFHLDHDRAGELVAVAEPDAWFTYYYWLDESKRPDFATTVEIHRKPGYDPAELFLDPNLPAPKLKIALTLLKKKLGFRSLLHVIPTDPSVVKGSHGVAPADPDDGPLFLTNHPTLRPAGPIDPTAVCDLLLRHLTA